MTRTPTPARQEAWSGEAKPLTAAQLAALESIRREHDAAVPSVPSTANFGRLTLAALKDAGYVITQRTTLDILKAARARIADPKRWTQGAAGRDRRGYRTEGRGMRRAVQWCALGAVDAEAAGDGGMYDNAWDALDAASPFRCGALLVNDELGHEATIAMFDRAIAKLEAAS